MGCTNIEPDSPNTLQSLTLFRAIPSCQKAPTWTPIDALARKSTGQAILEYFAVWGNDRMFQVL